MLISQVNEGALAWVMTLICNLDSNSSGIRGDAFYECYESSEHGYLLSYIIARIANWLLFFIFKRMLCLILLTMS